MKKKFRLKEAKEFKQTMNKGKCARSSKYLVFLKPNDKENLRVGISVSKKIGNAVIRAKVRRQIRAFFSVYNMYEKRYDIVILVRSGFVTGKSIENREELKQKIEFLIKMGENSK